MIDFSVDNDFSFWLPMLLEKSESTTTKTGRRVIQGIASTSHEDLQKENVDQRGIDFSYFLKYGYYNNDHKPGFENKVGQPLECRVDPKGLWTKGFLFKEHKVADAIWELALALEASQSERKLGFSIQGKVLRRAGQRILSCWVQDIAITAAPINTNTWFDIVKSLAALPYESWVAPEELNLSPRLISPVHKSNCTTCQNQLTKAKTVTRSIDESTLDLKKTDDEHKCDCHEKALTSGSPVTSVESLEGGLKDQEWGHASVKKSVQLLVDNPLEFNECVDLVRTQRKLSKSDAHVVVEAIFAMNGIKI